MNPPFFPPRTRSISTLTLASLTLYLLTDVTSASAQKLIHCPDGDRYLIDLKEIAIQYEGYSMAGTLSSLSVLGAGLTVTPRKLQEAAVATQQWNEFLKGLVGGYNSCAISKEQYAEGLQHIYPRLKQDAAGLEEIRKLLSDHRKADQKRLQRLLDTYYKNLYRFAEIGQCELIMKRVEAVAERLISGQQQILAQQKSDTERILERLQELERTGRDIPIETPQEIREEINDIKTSLRAKANEAVVAYSKGYELQQSFRFGEAIPYLQGALAIVKLPHFYFALGAAFASLPDLEKAEETLRQGLALPQGELDKKHEGMLAGGMGIVLLAKGDTEGALTYSKRSVHAMEQVYGPDDPNIGDAVSILSFVLQQKGELDGALCYAQQVLRIYEKNYGTDDPAVAEAANNLSTILLDKGDLDGALCYVKRALRIDENKYGPDHPYVGVDVGNVALVLRARGDLEGALHYAERALKIDEKTFGPDYPKVAIDANNIGGFLRDKGDLEGACRYTERALRILQNAYGPENNITKSTARNLEGIRRALR